jgi:hypothetical protein
MKLNGWSIKAAVFSVLVLLSVALYGQDGKRKGIWPDHVKLQYAGGIGFFSAGAGYTNKKQWLEGDLFYGYVPKSVGSVAIHILTAKASFFPIKPIGESLQLKPLSLGLLVNYTFGQQYFGFTPENYPFRYYSHPTAFRGAAFAGGQLNKILKDRSIRSVGLYYEVITYDTELLSFFDNMDALDWDDIVNVGVGVRVGF